jgi:plastocyanin
MRIVWVISILFFTVAGAWAGDIEGQVTVMDPSGRKPLKSFADTVVYLDGSPEVVEETVEMDQRGKRFIPRLLPVVGGQTIRFSNSDVFQHSVFSPHPAEPFDLGRYGTGEERSIHLEVLGPHPIYCDIHQSMVADVYVVPNRHFAVTDAGGRFRIAGVPPGSYRLKAWHVLGGDATREVEVTDATVSVTMTLQSQKHVREVTRHKNKHGQDYPLEYEQNYTY